MYKDVDNEPLTFHDEERYRPKKYTDKVQQVSIYVYLCIHYEWYSTSLIVSILEFFHIIVQDKYCQCKSFITNTIINIDKAILKSDIRDKANAPNGCTASLIDEKTHYMSLKLPADSKKSCSN